LQGSGLELSLYSNKELSAKLISRHMAGIALTTGKMFVCYGFKYNAMFSPTTGG